MGPLLRLWTYSTTDGTYASWTIFVRIGSQRPGRPLVREILWKRRQDEQRLASPNRQQKLRATLQATIHVRDAELSSEDLDPFLDAAARLYIPSKPQEEALPEADSSGFEGYRSLTHLRMEWQGAGPAEWSDTIAWVVQLRDLLLSSLRERERA